MANSYFEFKQFKVQQDRAAMKVGTDGILLGAWVPINAEDARILDVGTGTGLIALMVAQRSCAHVDAIDSEAKACLQAEENVRCSPWAERISVLKTRVQKFETEKRFDAVICNPPFYQNASGMSETSRSLARHGVDLTYSDLISNVARLLCDDGRFATILPSQYSDEFIVLAREHNLHLNRICYVYPKPGSPCKRHLLEFSSNHYVPVISQLTVESDVRHRYTPAFRKLTTDFYLSH